MDTIPQPTSKKRFWLFLILLIFVLVAAYVTFFKTNPDKVKPQIGAIPVEIVTATQQTIPVIINAIGTLTALQQVDVSPQGAGQVAKIGFKDGQEVRRGDLLFQLNDADALAQLASALAQQRWSQLDYQRKLRLFKQAAVAKQDVDLAKATLQENQATVAQKQVLVQDMHLTAPFNGKISSAQVSVGQYVGVGQTLATLVGLDHLRVVFSVPETYLPQLQLGQTLQVTSETLPGKTFAGIVLYIAPLVDTTTRMVQVQADLPNPKHQLTPGMYVKIIQQIAERPHTIVIPDLSLVASIEGNNVFVVQNNRAHQVAVQVGQRWDNQVEILSGLHLNDVVVISGQQKLHDGSPVRIISSAISSSDRVTS